MPSRTGTVVSLVTKAWPLLVKYGPQALAAFGLLTKFLKDNPGVPDWFRQRLEQLPTRLNDVQKRRGDAAKIRGTLEIIRDVARDAQTADEGVDASTYVLRADRIERGVKLAETQDRREQKTLLGKLKSDTDALLAEVLDAVSGTERDGATSTAANGATDGSIDTVREEDHPEQ